MKSIWNNHEAAFKLLDARPEEFRKETPDETYADGTKPPHSRTDYYCKKTSKLVAVFTVFDRGGERYRFTAYGEELLTRYLNDSERA